MVDRKKHDGSLNEVDELLIDDLPVTFAEVLDTPLPKLLEDPRTLDATEYGPAVLQLLQEIAFADIGEYLSWGKSGVIVKPSDELTPLQRRLIRTVKEDKDGNIVVELCSKDHAIRLLGQASGLLKEHTQISGQLDVSLVEALKSIDGQSRGLPNLRRGKDDDESV